MYSFAAERSYFSNHGYGRERSSSRRPSKARMKQEDFQALTPLFTLNINPYGYFALDFDKPSILEAA